MTSWLLLCLLTLLCRQHVHRVQACGGVYSSEAGSIRSPSYPSPYPDNQDCIYIINATEGYRIRLNFNSFQLEAGPEGCPYDFLQIRDGSSETSPSLGKFCNTVQSRVRSTGNSLWIKFHSDSSQSGAGFEAVYTTAIIPQKFLLVTHEGVQSGIYRIDIDTFTTFMIPIDGLGVPTAVDYDPLNQRIYWTDVQEKAIRSASLDGSDVRLVRNLGQNATPDGLSVDSLSKLIFYTDSGNKIIGMITMYSDLYRPVIDSGLESPRDIELDKHNGVMYWSDWGTSPKIERANYDGTERKTLASGSQGLVWPNALALDTTGGRLYWADAQTDVIGWVDLNGSTTSVILRYPGSHISGMDIYLNSLFVTDWGMAGSQAVTSYLHRMATDGSSREIFGTAEGGKLNDVRVYAEETEDTGRNGCGNNGDCSDICIPRPGNSSKCLTQNTDPRSVEETAKTVSVLTTATAVSVLTGAATKTTTTTSDRTTTNSPTTERVFTTPTDKTAFYTTPDLTSTSGHTVSVTTPSNNILSTSKSEENTNIVNIIILGCAATVSAVGTAVGVYLVCVLKTRKRKRERYYNEPVTVAAQHRQDQHRDTYPRLAPPSATPMGDYSISSVSPIYDEIGDIDIEGQDVFGPDDTRNSNAEYLHPADLCTAGYSSAEYLHPVDLCTAGNSSAEYLHPVDLCTAGNSSAEYLHPVDLCTAGYSIAEYLHPVDLCTAGNSSAEYLHPVDLCTAGYSIAEYLHPVERSPQTILT